MAHPQIVIRLRRPLAVRRRVVLGTPPGSFVSPACRLLVVGFYGRTCRRQLVRGAGSGTVAYSLWRSCLLRGIYDGTQQSAVLEGVAADARWLVVLSMQVNNASALHLFRFDTAPTANRGAPSWQQADLPLTLAAASDGVAFIRLAAVERSLALLVVDCPVCPVRLDNAPLQSSCTPCPPPLRLSSASSALSAHRSHRSRRPVLQAATTRTPPSTHPAMRGCSPPPCVRPPRDVGAVSPSSWVSRGLQHEAIMHRRLLLLDACIAAELRRGFAVPDPLHAACGLSCQRPPARPSPSQFPGRRPRGAPRRQDSADMCVACDPETCAGQPIPPVMVACRAASVCSACVERDVRRATGLQGGRQGVCSSVCDMILREHVACASVVGESCAHACCSCLSVLVQARPQPTRSVLSSAASARALPLSSASSSLSALRSGHCRQWWSGCPPTVVRRGSKARHQRPVGNVVYSRSDKQAGFDASTQQR